MSEFINRLKFKERNKCIEKAFRYQHQFGSIPSIIINPDRMITVTGDDDTAISLGDRITHLPSVPLSIFNKFKKIDVGVVLHRREDNCKSPKYRRDFFSYSAFIGYTVERYLPISDTRAIVVLRNNETNRLEVGQCPIPDLWLNHGVNVAYDASHKETQCPIQNVYAVVPIYDEDNPSSKVKNLLIFKDDARSIWQTPLEVYKLVDDKWPFRYLNTLLNLDLDYAMAISITARRNPEGTLTLLNRAIKDPVMREELMLKPINTGLVNKDWMY